MSSWGVSVPSETFTKVMFSCLWGGLQLLSGTGGLSQRGLGCCSLSVPGPKRPNMGSGVPPPLRLEAGRSLGVS